MPLALPPMAEPTPAPARPVEAVLFDLYGTLVRVSLDEDSPALWARLAAALGGTGRAVDADRVRREFQAILREEGTRRHEGFVMEPVFRRLLTRFAAGDDVARLGRRFRELSLKELALFPYVTRLLEALTAARCRTAIVSNTEAVLTQFDLGEFPVLRTVDAIVLSSEVGVRKPDPGIFQIALDRLETPPAAAVFVGNSLTDDVAGARRAGLRCVFLDEHLHGAEPVVASDGEVLRVPLTLPAIARALERFGWSGGGGLAGASSVP